MRRLLLTTLVVVLVAAPAAAQEVSDTAFFPIIARTTGAGTPPTQWVTDLAVKNLANRDLTIGIEFFPADQANDFDGTFVHEAVLTGRETRMWSDILGTEFGYSTNVKGSLLVSCSSEHFPANGEDPIMVATTRTYNTGSSVGTYGQTVSAQPGMFNAYADSSHIVGARNDYHYRSNLGIANYSVEDITVHFRIADSAGMTLVQLTRSIPALSVKQWSFANLGIGSVGGPLSVELWMDQEDVTENPCTVDWPNQFLAYVSKVDGNPQGSGDAEFLYAAPKRKMTCRDIL